MASVGEASVKTRETVRGSRSGLIYCLIAGLALEVAFGKRSSLEDQQGALQTISQQPFGRFLLVAVGVGLAAFAFWCFAQAALGEKLETSEDMNIFLRLGFAA